MDKDAAERILRGEPVDARRGPGARELAEFLRAAADAGADTSADSGGSVAFTEPGARGVGRSPLPGEEAALAAFREARERGGPSRSGRPLRESLPGAPLGPSPGLRAPRAARRTRTATAREKRARSARWWAARRGRSALGNAPASGGPFGVGS